MAARYDVAVLADLRFPGGTSAALAEELKAAAAGGYRTAILPLKGPVLRRPHPMHPEIAALIAAGSAELVDPLEEVECGLLLVHHPQLLTHAPQAPLPAARGRAPDRGPSSAVRCRRCPRSTTGPVSTALPPRCWVGRFAGRRWGPWCGPSSHGCRTVRRSRRRTGSTCSTPSHGGSCGRASWTSAA